MSEETSDAIGDINIEQQEDVEEIQEEIEDLEKELQELEQKIDLESEEITWIKNQINRTQAQIIDLNLAMDQKLESLEMRLQSIQPPSSQETIVVEAPPQPKSEGEGDQKDEEQQAELVAVKLGRLEIIKL